MAYLSLIIVSIVITYNLSQIISESTFPLFKWLRNLEGNLILDFLSELTSCFLCTSVWVGCLISFWIFDIGSILKVEHLSWAVSGLFYSGMAWFIHCWEEKIG